MPYSDGIEVHDRVRQFIEGAMPCALTANLYD